MSTRFSYAEWRMVGRKLPDLDFSDIVERRAVAGTPPTGEGLPLTMRRMPGRMIFRVSADPRKVVRPDGPAWSHFRAARARMNASAGVVIDGRDAIPVRALSFITNWALARSNTCGGIRSTGGPRKVPSASG